MYKTKNIEFCFSFPILYFVKSETPLSLVLGGIRTHNLLIFGLTTKPDSSTHG